MWRSRRLWSIFLIMGLLAAIMVGCGKKENIVAKYDGGQITENQYKDYINVLKAVFQDPSLAQEIDAGKKETLQFVLNYQVMSDYVAAQVKDTDAINKTAEKNFNQYKSFVEQQLGQAKNLSQFYADKKVTEQQLKDFFLQQSKVQEYFSKDITEVQKKQKYDQLKASGDLTRADVRHILIMTDKRSKAEAKKKAEDILRQLRNGADFAKLAAANTEDPGSKATGGLYKDMDLSQTVPEFKKAVLTLPLNKISDPVETQYGYHIIRVEKRTVETYDQIKDRLTLSMAQDKQSQFLDTKVKGIIKEEQVPPSMIKAQPAQSAPVPGAPPTSSQGQNPNQQPPASQVPADQSPAKK